MGIVNLIAKRIEEMDIETEDVVTQELRNKVEEIIDSIIIEKIPVSISEIIEVLWKPIETKLLQLVNVNLEEERRKWIVLMEKRWSEYMNKIKLEQGKNSLDYLLDGDIAHACVVGILNNDSSPATLRACLMLYSMTNVPCPPINTIKKLVKGIDNEKIKKIFEAEIALIEDKITTLEYSKVFTEIVNEIDIDSCDIEEAIALITPNLARMPQVAKKLAEKFKDVSKYFNLHLNMILKRNEIIARAYSITSYDEFKNYVSTLKEDVDKAEKVLSKYVKTSMIRRILGLVPRGSEVNRAIMTYSQVLEILIFIQTLMLQSPVLDDEEKRELLNDMIKIYRDYYSRLLRDSFPIFISTIINVFQGVGISLAIAYEMLNKKKVIDMIDDFTTDVLSILRKEPIREKHYAQSLSSMLASLMGVCLKEDRLLVNIPEILIRVVNSMNLRNIEAWRVVIPYNYIAISFNFSSILASLATLLLDGEEKGEYVVKAVNYLFDTFKWLLTNGKALKDAIIFAIEAVYKSLKYIKKDDFERIISQTLDFIEVMTPDKKKYLDDYCMLIQEVIRLLEQYVRIHNIEEFRDKAEQIRRELQRYAS